MKNFHYLFSVASWNITTSQKLFSNYSFECETKCENYLLGAHRPNGFKTSSSSSSRNPKKLIFHLLIRLKFLPLPLWIERYEDRLWKGGKKVPNNGIKRVTILLPKVPFFFIHTVTWLYLRHSVYACVCMRERKCFFSIECREVKTDRSIDWSTLYRASSHRRFFLHFPVSFFSLKNAAPCVYFYASQANN